MIDKNKIPDKLYEEMLCLFGKDRTERIAKNVGYSYHGLIWKVSDEKFKRKFGIQILPLFGIVFIIIFLLNIL